MAVLILKNFSTMIPDSPEYSAKNQHYLLSGVDPFYYLQQSTVQEQKFAPMAASRTFVRDINPYTGVIVTAVATSFSSFDIILGTNTGNVYGTGNGFSDFGQPIVLSVFNSPRVGVFAGNVFWLYEGSGNVYRKPITTPAAAWTTVSGFSNPAAGSSVRYLKPFLDFLAVSDNDGTTLNSNHIVRKIDSSYVVTKVLDLGVGWNIQSLENYDNRYLAIVGAYSGDGTNSAAYTDINYVFLWNGYGARYQSAIRIPGIFIDMKAIAGSIYFIVLERVGQYSLHVLSGNSLKKVFNLGIDSAGVLSGSLLTSGYVLFNYNDQVGISLASKGQLIYNPVSKARYILTPSNYNIIQRGGSSGILYSMANNGVLTYSTGYSPISYQSQWVPFKDLKMIVVKYATPPAAGDSIQVTLDGYDEDGNASASLALTTITSTTKYNAYKTYLDCQGFQGHLVRVKLTTVSASGWAPIIRELELKN